MNLIVDESDQLEAKKDWANAYEVLKRLMRDNPDEPKYLCKLGFLCWYHLMEDEENQETLDFDEWAATLLECFAVGQEKWSNDAGYLFIFSYMMGIAEYLFENDTYDYEGIQKLSDELARKAGLLEPDHPLIQRSVINADDYAIEGAHEMMSELANEQINELGLSGLMLDYFKDVTSVRLVTKRERNN